MLRRAFATTLLAAGGLYLGLALLLPRGSMAQPGPGFFPLAVGIALCGLATGFLVVAFRRPAPATSPPERTPGAARARVGAAAAGLAGLSLFVSTAGYPLVAFLFVTLLLRQWPTGWPTAIAVALLGAVGTYYLFGVVLSVPLPRGAWLP